ncbi:MAG: hypothetical protein AAB388_00655 [Patescibacteria group bacterium]
MVNKKQVETILKINGLTSRSPDEQIRSLLLSARFNKDEIDTALLVLRENKITRQQTLDGLHKVFRTDNALKPREISSLLGVDMNVDTLPVSTRRRAIVGWQFILVWLLAVMLAVTGILFYMYVNNIGLFHPSTHLLSLN